MPAAPPTILGIVPARGGSRGIPRKNVKAFAGKPLLAWTIDVAKESGVCSRILLSTEDEEIAQVGKRHGAEVPFLRPGELAQDATPTAPVIRHALEWLQRHDGWSPEAVMVLEPTSPGRRPFHLREAARLLQERDADSVAGVSELPHHYAPAKALRLRDDGTIAGIDGTPVRAMIHQRQELPVTYAFNGVLFACKRAVLLQDPPTLWGERVLAYPVERKYSFDLDWPEDWPAAEARFQQLLHKEGVAYANTGRHGPS